MIWVSDLPSFSCSLCHKSSKKLIGVADREDDSIVYMICLDCVKKLLEEEKEENL